MSALTASLRSLVNKFGFDIHRLIPSAGLSEGQPYKAMKLPGGGYSPWNLDAAFQDVYNAIQGFTYVDLYRCYELWKLVEQSAKLSGGCLVEIGVWRGGTGAVIATQAKKSGILDKVYLCDTFEGVVKATEKDSLYKGGEHNDTSAELVEGLMDQLKLDNVKVLTGIFPDQTGHELQSLSFRFCHIDVDVYQGAKDIVDWIWDRMVPGGIVVFDDYGDVSCDGVAKYVDEQMLLKDRIVLYNLNGHAIFIKR